MHFTGYFRRASISCRHCRLQDRSAPCIQKLWPSTHIHWFQAPPRRDSQYLPVDVQVIAALSPMFRGALWRAKLDPCQLFTPDLCLAGQGHCRSSCVRGVAYSGPAHHSQPGRWLDGPTMDRGQTTDQPGHPARVQVCSSRSHGRCRRLCSCLALLVWPGLKRTARADKEALPIGAPARLRYTWTDAVNAWM